MRVLYFNTVKIKLFYVRAKPYTKHFLEKTYHSVHSLLT